MSPIQIIILLTVVGFLMLTAEVFVPGLVLGILGFLCLAGAVVFAYVEFGPLAGTLVLAGVSGATMVGFITWMIAFPYTRVGRRLMLNSTLNLGEGEKSVPAQALLGKQGVALTFLRPAGTARIEGKKIDVVTEGGLVEKGRAIVVVAQEGMKVVVRASE